MSFRLEHGTRLSKMNDPKVQRQSFSYQLPPSTFCLPIFIPFLLVSCTFYLSFSYCRWYLPQSVLFHTNFVEKKFILVVFHSNPEGDVFDSIRRKLSKFDSIKKKFLIRFEVGKGRFTHRYCQLVWPAPGVETIM